MTAERERTGEELLAESERSRAQLAAVTARLNWFIAELQRELDSDDEDQETDDAGG
jgi:hypothetical protein